MSEVIARKEPWQPGEIILAKDLNRIEKNINGVVEQVSKITGVQFGVWESGYYTTGDAGSAVTKTTSENYVTCLMPTSEGDVITLDATGGSGDQRLYVWLDANGNAVYNAGKPAANQAGERTLTTPANAVAVAINNHITVQVSGYYAYIGKFVTEKITDATSDKQGTLVFDTVPTENSTNPITSGGVYTAISYGGIAYWPESPASASLEEGVLVISQSGSIVTINGTHTTLYAYAKLDKTFNGSRGTSNSGPGAMRAYSKDTKLMAGKNYKIEPIVMGGECTTSQEKNKVTIRLYREQEPEQEQEDEQEQEQEGELFIEVKMNSSKIITPSEDTMVSVVLCSYGQGNTFVNYSIMVRISEVPLIADKNPTRDSENAVSSDGVYRALEAIQNNIGMEYLPFQPYTYYWFDSNGGCRITPTASEKYAGCMSTCVPGDVFVINVYSGKGHQRGYAFLNSSLTPIPDYYSKTDTMIKNRVLIAPEDAAYLIVNNNLEELSSGYFAQKGSMIKNALNNEIPNYYNANNYLTNKIDTLLERSLTITGDSFIFITDYHAHKNAGHSPAIIEKIYNQTGISKLFCGGDIGTSTGLNGMKINAEAFATLYRTVPHFYAVTGNHEWKVASNSLPVGTYNSVYNYYISQMDGSVSEMSDFGDYWIDSKGAKIRYYFLNQNINAQLTDITLKWFINTLADVPAGYGIVVTMHNAYHPKTYSLGREKLGYLNWWENSVGLCNLITRRISQVLDAIRTGTTVKYALRPYDNTIDPSLNVTPRNHTGEEKNACADYNPIFSTFAEGTNTGAYTDIVMFDGASVHAKGVYPIAIFCGHRHEDAAYDPASAESFSDMMDENTVYLLNGTWYKYDAEESSATYGQRVAMQGAAGTDGLNLSQTETVPPILVILTTTDCYQLNHSNTDPTIRELDTISEQAFDIVQIDTAGRKVYCTRIGAGNDRVFNFI